MEKKTLGIIGLVVTILFCGLPGLCGLCAGPMFVVIGAIPGSDIDIFGSSDPSAAIAYGIGTICVSVLFVAIPVVIGFLTLRKKSNALDDAGFISE
ncbi:MAG TPA: hypothetical protein DEH25_16880 [Chloroflexi bacterium]|nr:hypothetical protein [Chloroflexota bacterium]HBY09580.1 hypothetical protein [Chloroflexota bacterium]